MNFVPETPPDRSLAGIGKGFCKEVGKCVNLGRAEWIKTHAKGNVLDVGGNEGSGWTVPIPMYPHATRKWIGRKKNGTRVLYPMPHTIEAVTVFDCDDWKGFFPLVRGDAHNLPFPDGAYNTVVLGDILEHVADDYRVLAEAVRVAKDRVIGTTPDEYGWDQSLNPFKPVEEWVKEYGSHEAMEHEQTKGLKTEYATCVDAVSDAEVPHLHHVRWYDYEKMVKLLRSAGKPFVLEHLHYHSEPPMFTNFAFTIEK